ncbi:histidinol-phosphatase [Mangrovibacterium marinum]|nr:histidinol-phosphatase [Mangrovibacterium marinum]
MTDYHIHSILSDGKNTHEEMIQAAIDKGLDEIGFSDHICLNPVDWSIARVDLPVMVEQVQLLRDKYRDQITIKLGAEVDYLEGRETEIAQLLSSLPLDYVIGSVHFIDDWNFDTDKSLYGKWSNNHLYQRYFGLIQKAAQSGLFDIIGHLDIIKKFRIYPETDQSALIDETLRIIKNHDLVVELNTGGYDRPCAEFTPSPTIIERCFHHQIPVTLTSDAHRTSHVARHFDSAAELLRTVGYQDLVRFTNRQRHT